MGEHKNKEAYKAGYVDGKKAAYSECVYECLDEMTPEERAKILLEWGATSLDAVRSEIETDTDKWWYGVNDDCFMKLSDVIAIIDKYRKETEQCRTNTTNP